MHIGTLTADAPGKFAIRWDEARGSASIEILGFWTVEDGAVFFAAAANVFTKSRARHGGALVLFDMTIAQVSSGSVVRTFGLNRLALIKPIDRLAVVVTSSLVKLQMKRMQGTDGTAEFFVSRNAADTWLHAHLPSVSQRIPA